MGRGLGVKKLPKLTAAEISEKIAALLSELSTNKVHAVIVAAATGKKQTTTFGVETNTSTGVATILLKAGLKRIEELQ